MTTNTQRKPWEPPTDLEVLPHTDELLGLRDRLERAERAFEEAQARPAELVAERDKVEQGVLDGNAKAGHRLAELNLRIARAPGEAAAAADGLAGALIDWARFVQNAAEDVRLEASADEKELNSANRLDRARLFHGSREIPGASGEIRRAVAESQPLRDRQTEADRLKADAGSQVRRLLGINSNRPHDVAEARRRFIEQARADAAAGVTR